MSALKKKENNMEMLPSKVEVELAKESSRSLARLIPTKKSTVEILISEVGEAAAPIKIPMSAFRLLVNLLSEMAKGNAVTLMPLNAEITSQQAADILNVSRPFLIKLLDEGKIPFKEVGRHRRISVQDLMTYKITQDAKSKDAREKLTAEAQKLNLGYE